jgi:phosphate transport system permease protein
LPKPLHTTSLRRRLSNWIALGLITLAALIVTVPLFLILATVVLRGLGALNWAFLTQIPKPIGEEGGGMGNAIAGSILLLGYASLIGVPLGIGAGVFLAEYGRNKFGNVVRFTADALNGVPSVVIGMTAWALVVVPQKHFSMLAGSVALGIMMIPVISRTTEEVLLLRTASAGIVTSVMLAFARIAGESAPLMFTAFGNEFWSMNPDQPVASLPLQIYKYAIQPYEQAHAQAWTAALVLISMIVVTVTLFRFIVGRHAIKGVS